MSGSDTPKQASRRIEPGGSGHANRVGVADAAPIGDMISYEARFARVLDQATNFDPARLAALAEKITAAACIIPQRVDEASPTASVDDVAMATSIRSDLGRRRSFQHPTRSTWSTWSSALLLAASLVMGLFVGQTDISSASLPSLVEMAGLSIDNAGHHLGDKGDWPGDWDEE
jgi:hypothetical protein